MMAAKACWQTKTYNLADHKNYKSENLDHDDQKNQDYDDPKTYTYKRKGKKRRKKEAYSQPSRSFKGL